MTRRLSPRHRTTRLGSSDGRVGGAYEQCDLDSSEGAGAAMSLVADGLVGCGGSIEADRLRAMAGSDRLSDFDCRVVLVTDLLGALRLDVEAELIMWHGLDGTRIATPIGRILDDDTTQILLGGCDLTTAPDWSAPPVLRSVNWIADEFMELGALTALTFADFVRAPR